MRRRRNGPEALKPVDHPTWLTVRDAFGKLLESRELPAHADLKAALLIELGQRAADGWFVEDLPNDSFAGAFCSRNGIRVLVGISRQDPALATTAHAGYATWTTPRQR